MTTPESPQPDPAPYVVVPERRPRKAAFVTAGIALAVVALGGAVAMASDGSAGGSGSGGTGPGSEDKVAEKALGVDGTLKLVDADTAGSGCVGQGGYQDIRPGTQVSLLDESSKILALTSLELDEVATKAENDTLNEGSTYKINVLCVYTFKLAELPKAAFYKFAIGGGNGGNGRGGLTYSRDDMVANGGHVALSLG